MRDVLLVGAGGAIGAMMRYLVGVFTSPVKDKSPLPLSTLLVNVIGCLLIGVLATLAEEKHMLSPESRNFLIVGILGAFTTFSTFSYESVSLLNNASFGHFVGNLMAQLLLGLGAVWLGMNLVRLFER
jgi:CrcB protein